MGILEHADAIRGEPGGQHGQREGDGEAWVGGLQQRHTR
jgi:hypothetical protein